jgi:DNA-binding NtrC family response regulator
MTSQPDLETVSQTLRDLHSMWRSIDVAYGDCWELDQLVTEFTDRPWTYAEAGFLASNIRTMRALRRSDKEIRDKINQVTPEYGRHMIEFENATRDEAAEVVGVSKRTLKLKLRRAVRDV